MGFAIADLRFSIGADACALPFPPCGHSERSEGPHGGGVDQVTQAARTKHPAQGSPSSARLRVTVRLNP